MKKYAVLLVMMLVVAFAGSAQDVVKWTHSVKMKSATEGTVTFTATIDKGWHVYGLDIPQGGPKPTTFDFAKSTGISLAGDMSVSPKPTVMFDKAFDMELKWWAGKAVFTQKFKITDPKTAKIVVNLRYMACNDTNCMPPKRQTFEIDIPQKKK